MKDEKILMTILAKTDAVFWPIRNHNISGRVLFYERRREFMECGLPWASGETSEAGRKAAQRDLEALASAGKVLVFKGRERTLGVRLSEKADDDIRRMICLATLADALMVLDELYRRLNDGDVCDFVGKAWTSEQSLTGIEWGDHEQRWHYVRLTENVYPLLWRGLVESNASIRGHVWYRLTDAGLKLAQERVKNGQSRRQYPPKQRTNKQFDETARRFYLDEQRREIDALESDKPKDHNDLGEIPMPVSTTLRKSAGRFAQAD